MWQSVTVDRGHIMYNLPEKRYRFMKSVYGTPTSCTCLILQEENKEIFPL